jgi:hypothetical protein
VIIFFDKSLTRFRRPAIDGYHGGYPAVIDRRYRLMALFIHAG